MNRNLVYQKHVCNKNYNILLESLKAKSDLVMNKNVVVIIWVYNVLNFFRVLRTNKSTTKMYLDYSMFLCILLAKNIIQCCFFLQINNILIKIYHHVLNLPTVRNFLSVLLTSSSYFFVFATSKHRYSLNNVNKYKCNREYKMFFILFLIKIVRHNSTDCT